MRDHRERTAHDRWIVTLCGAVVVVAALVCGGRSLAMAGHVAMDDTGTGRRAGALGPSEPMHGMPVTEMPEMAFAAASLAVLVLVGMRSHGRSPARHRPLHGQRTLVVAAAVAALAVDIGKTSTLGFVIPGMRAEYGLSAPAAAMLAVSGLTGTAVGALTFPPFAARAGRRFTFQLAALGFVATSMCGAMPTFPGNIVMCFVMGTVVGGFAPLLVDLLAGVLSTRHRGPAIVTCALAASAFGYLLAAGGATWLEPIYGWRVLWLIGVPTGMLLLAAVPLVPDAPVHTDVRSGEPDAVVDPGGAGYPRIAQCGYAALVGLIGFGLTTWLPTLARAGGQPAHVADGVIATTALWMVPAAVPLTLGYRALGPVRLASVLALATGVFLAGLLVSTLRTSSITVFVSALCAALLTLNAMSATFLPVTADLTASSTRLRSLGLVSFSNRIGGLTGPLVLSFLVGSIANVVAVVAVGAVVCGALAAWIELCRRRAVTAGGSARGRTRVGNW